MVPPTIRLSATERAIAYHPRGFSPNSVNFGISPGSILNDLAVLKKLGFRSLVTYGARGYLGAIPQFARAQGFDGSLIMGIWDIANSEEWNNAMRQLSFADGYCLGNELALRMVELRRATGKPITTSEPIDSYLNGPYRQWLITQTDWLFPLAHPFWARHIDPLRAIDWISARHDYLTAITGQRVILKEAGLPTDGLTSLTEDDQLALFQGLQKTRISFFYFEAFDQPWKPHAEKHHEVEAHWGIFHTDGRPKKAAEWLAKN